MYRVFVTFWLLKFPSRWLQSSHLNSLSNNWQIKQNKYPAMQPYIHTQQGPSSSSTAKTNNPHYIPIYIQQDATLHSLFISGNCSTCFGWYLHPSSWAHTTVSTASGICHTVTATCRYRGRVGTGLSVMLHTQISSNSSMIVAGSSNSVTNTRCYRYSCVRSWWWVEVPPETCRAVSRCK
jgi:hypothetical protein